jgi:hypothetical protein
VKLLRFFCLHPLLSLGDTRSTGGREDKRDSERKGQRVNPGVVVLRHGTLPPSLFIPRFPRELVAVVAESSM